MSFGIRAQPFGTAAPEPLSQSESQCTSLLIEEKTNIVFFSSCAPFVSESHDWLGYWGKHMKATGFRTVKDYQKVRGKNMTIRQEAEKFSYRMTE